MKENAVHYYLKGIHTNNPSVLQEIRTQFLPMFIHYSLDQFGATEEKAQQLLGDILHQLKKQAIQTDTTLSFDTLLLQVAKSIWQAQYAKKEHKDMHYIQAIWNRDRQMTLKIYEDFFPMVLKMITTNRGTFEDAKDIYHDALAAILQKEAQPDFVLTCKFSSFLYTIAYNLWMNRLNKKVSDEVELPKDVKERPSEADIQSVLEASERYKVYKDNFVKLSEACQQALKLFLDGTPMRKIAEVMGFTVQYARNQKMNCKKQLEKLIKADTRFKEL